MANSSQKQAKKSWITEGLVVAATPLVAYILTFQYEMGFASVYGIPSEFINFNLTNVLTVMFALWAILLFFIPFINLVYMLIWSRHDNAIYRSLMRVTLALPWIIIPIYLHSTRWKEWIFFLIVPIFIVWLEFIHPLIYQRNEPTYQAKLEAQEIVESQITSIFDHLGKTGNLIIVFLLLAFFTAYSAGRAAAFDEVKFLVANSSPECVVLRMYGDNLVCAPFDRNTKEVSRRFHILKLANDPNLVLSLEEVGPLDLEKSTQTSTPATTPQYRWVTVTPVISATTTTP